MNLIEIVFAILNVAAIIFVPVIAVVIGQKLQERAEKRKDKLMIFKILMANRFGWSPDSVYAMNIIDIVFADNEVVRERWRDYYEKLCIQNLDEMQLQKVKKAQEKMLESMAIVLGYKDKITWETIQNPYVPKGMLDAVRQQQTIQRGQEQLAGAMGDLISKINKQ